MSGNADFNALYNELGVDAGCSADQFKQAYRRRVRELHPDHPGLANGTERLQRLNQLYASAVEFQRMHGRLPGALRQDGSRALADSPPAGPPPIGDAGDGSMAGSRHRTRYFLSVALVVAVLLWMSARDGQHAGTVQAPTEGAAVAESMESTVGALLTIGMDTGRVLAIQGAPLNAHETRWDYGPSWIDFRCEKVVDWYSSPLRPLRVAGTKPAMGNQAVPPKGSRSC